MHQVTERELRLFRFSPRAPDGAILPFPLPRVGTIRHYDTNLSVWEDNQEFEQQRLVCRSLVSRLRARGFRMKRDGAFSFVGKKGDLEVLADTGGRTSKIEFFQNIIVDRTRSEPNGRYDYDRYRKMPRYIRTQCLVEMKAMAEKMVELGYTLPAGWAPDALLRSVLDACEDRPHLTDPLAWFNAKWGVRRSDIDADGWPVLSYAYGNRDAHGTPLRNGDVRTLRDRSSGRLLTGQVYTNYNDQWTLWRNGAQLACDVSQCFFVCDRPDQERRRTIRKQPERVRLELDRALKKDDYGRVATLARVLQGYAAEGKTP